MLRPAIDADRDMILVWRNHPRTRAASLSAREITAAEHAAWWRSVMTDPSRELLIYCHDEIPAGVVGVVLAEDGTATWNYYLDIEGLTSRDDLLPAWLTLEREAIRYAFDERGIRVLGGEVLTTNTPVLALHRRLGFQVTREYTREVDGVVQTIAWIELDAASARMRAHHG